ncbi:MAG TPA: Asp-tRNA(Asn)/Glu-tRNA(Gln) amidotransferase subunit GatC [Caldilineae bacterium]|nr:Asp-tRNA(Asn)/Glu-tRNA(Gln) amidotransferase subunit GatC [Caldilineae bacterium]
MSLTLEEVRHIAELAKLGLTPEEEERFRDQLSAILDYFARLQEVDTSAIPATATVLPTRNVMRDDEVQPSLSREDALANAPDAADGQFRVQAVLE